MPRALFSALVVPEPSYSNFSVIRFTFLAPIFGFLVNSGDRLLLGGLINATVAVQSLDGNSIGQSKNILVSLSARWVPKPGDPTSYYSEPIEGKLSIAAPQGLTLHVWDAGAGKMRLAPAPYKDGRYFVVLDRKLRSYWLVLRGRPGGSSVAIN